MDDLAPCEGEVPWDDDGLGVHGRAGWDEYGYVGVASVGEAYAADPVGYVDCAVGYGRLPWPTAGRRGTFPGGG